MFSPLLNKRKFRGFPLLLRQIPYNHDLSRNIVQEFQYFFALEICRFPKQLLTLKVIKTFSLRKFYSSSRYHTKC